MPTLIRLLIPLLYCAQALAGTALSPITEGVLRGDATTVRQALDAGASANAPDPLLRRPPLMLAVTPGIHPVLDVIDLLAARGANLEYRDPDTGITPLLEAMNTGKNRGVYVDTDLQTAATVVMRLLRLGANPNQADLRGRTPLMQAALLRRPEVITALIKAGAKIQSADLEGDTALMFAAAADDAASAKLLLAQAERAGVRLFSATRNQKGQTAHQVGMTTGAGAETLALLTVQAPQDGPNRPQTISASGTEPPPNPTRNKWMASGLTSVATLIGAAAHSQYGGEQRPRKPTAPAPQPAVTPNVATTTASPPPVPAPRKPSIGKGEAGTL